MSHSVYNTKAATHVSAVIGFNARRHELFIAEDEPAEDARQTIYFVDLSASVEEHSEEIRSVLGAFLFGTNADGKVKVLRPSGATHMVAAVRAYSHLVSKCDVVIITDGLENGYHGDLPCADGIVIKLQGLSCDSPEYRDAVATWLSTLGCQIYYVGIGNQAIPMVHKMVKRRNVHVAHVPARTDHRSIVGTVRALRNRSAHLAVTNPTGEEQAVLQPPIQKTVLIPLSDEVKATIAALPEAEVASAASAGALIHVAGPNAPPQPQPATASEAKDYIKAAIESVRSKFSLGEEDIKLATALLVQFMELGIGVQGGLPSTLISGKERSNSRLYEVSSDEVTRFLNVLLSALARLPNNKTLTKTGVLNEDRAIVVEDVSLKFAKKTTLYQSGLDKAVLEQLAADETLCAPRGSLRKRFAGRTRPRADTDAHAKATVGGY